MKYEKLYLVNLKKLGKENRQDKQKIIGKVVVLSLIGIVLNYIKM